MSWTTISENLFCWSDTCNVYCVRQGQHAVLIDAGSGAVVDKLDEIGVTSIDWVLHTHHHRDQAWGTNRVRATGAKVAVPEHERALFDQVELFWQYRRVYDNYNDRNDFFSVAANIPVDAELQDYETFRWRDLGFQVVPAKGHTHGSSMLLAEVDGRTVAFTGDLLAAGGRLYQYHAMEYGYGDRIGCVFTLESIRALAKTTPALALPSHGAMIEDPVGDCARLEQRLLDLIALGEGTRLLGRSTAEDELRQLPRPRFTDLSPHLLWGGPYTCSNFYVILSESGKACLVDYGHSSFTHMMVGAEIQPFETMRFVVHHLDELRERYGVTEIDVVLVTHIHDDHTAGIPYLQRHEGTEVWALDEVAKVLASPAEWSSTPCTLPTPIELKRVFADGERFTWEEYELSVHHAPGQTEFHSVIAGQIDGNMVAFTGDNVFESLTPGPSGGWDRKPYETTVLRNSFQLWMHRRCADVMDQIAPTLVCPGHRHVIEWSPTHGRDYRSFIEREERAVRGLVAEPADHYVDLFWARLRPYLAEVAAGDEMVYTLMLRNNLERTANYSARLLTPEGWETADAAVELSLQPGDRGAVQLKCSPPSTPPPGATGYQRHLVTAEILVDGVSAGPVAEALVTVQPAQG